MTQSPNSLGTLLRQLIDHLDGAVDEAYRDAGLDYRARYTPIVRTLRDLGPSTLRTIAGRVGVSHSAISQTVSQMADRGLVSTRPGADARQRVIALTPLADAILPDLQRCWDRTEIAARSLDSDLGLELSAVLERTLAALEHRPFAERIRDAGET